MSELHWGVLFGLAIGATLASVTWQMVTVDMTTGYKTAIEQCEKDLPRSKRCRITAIPVGEPNE